MSETISGGMDIDRTAGSTTAGAAKPHIKLKSEPKRGIRYICYFVHPGSTVRRWWEACITPQGYLYGRFRSRKDGIHWCRVRKAHPEDYKVAGYAPKTWEQQYWRELELLADEGFMFAA